MSIAEKAGGRDLRSWVLHGIDGVRLYRLVIPLGQITNKGDVTWDAKDVAAMEVEVTAFPDASSNYAYHYIYDSTLIL